MSTSRSADLTLTFSVGRQDDDGWPWVIGLEKVEPRGTGLEVPCGCANETTNFGSKICEACAVELSIEQLGEEQWLLDACDLPIVTEPMPDDNRFHRPACVGRIIDQEGTLTVKGHMTWSGPSSTYDDDYEEMFVVDESAFVADEKGEPR